MATVKFGPTLYDDIPVRAVLEDDGRVRSEIWSPRARAWVRGLTIDDALDGETMTEADFARFGIPYEPPVEG